MILIYILMICSSRRRFTVIILSQPRDKFCSYYRLCIMLLRSTWCYLILESWVIGLYSELWFLLISLWWRLLAVFSLTCISDLNWIVFILVSSSFLCNLTCSFSFHAIALRMRRPKRNSWNLMWA